MDARPFSILRTPGQWARARHDDTAPDLPAGGVTLAWRDEPDYAHAAGREGAPALGAGLGIDSRCRVYRTRSEAGTVERWAWAGGPAGPPEMVLETPAAPSAGEFTVDAPAGGPLREPRGVAVDDDDRLWVAEAGARRVVVWDVWTRRLLRRVPVPGRPLDI